MGNRCEFCQTKLEFDYSPWISVEDRLPELEKNVLIFSNFGTYTGELKMHNEWADHHLYEIDQVTHWMPLPSPPREDK